MFKKIVAYIKEAREELKKVTWPDRDEVTSFTMVVIVSVIIVSLFLWLVDSALMAIIQLVIS
ncbi:MAG TPA: preprotein translocase subunit SecE [Spirochaetota bacterium]|nr:preprotein translocase subunit SecE [Spirochaetota bacterium]